MVNADTIHATVMLLWTAYGWQFVKYCAVAMLGLLMHLGILSALVELLNLHYTVAFLAALPFTFASKFLLDKTWTFKQ
jgi:putative flippase GtrA